MEKKPDSEISTPFEKHPPSLPLDGNSGEKYRDFLKNIHDGCFELDLAGKFIFFNDSVCRITGYSSDELMGMSYREYTNQETAKKVFTEYNNVFSTGDPSIGFGWSITRKDGALRYIETSVSLQKDSDGQPIGFIGIVNDVTERRRSDELLRQSEEKYRLLAEHVKDFVWLLNLDLKLTYVSPSVKRASGYTFAELKEFTLDKLLTEESFQKAMEMFSSEMSNAEINPPPPDYRRSLEVQFRCKDNHLLWIEATLSFLQDENRKPMYILGEGRDITERKQAEERIRQSEEKYRLLAEHTKDGVWITDLNLKVTYVSPSIANLLGWTVEEVEQLPLDKRFTPASLKKAIDFYSVELPKALAASPEYALMKTLNLEFIAKDGHTLWVECMFSFIRDKNGEPVSILGEGRDITERKQMEEELQQTLDSLRKAVGTTIQVLVSALEARDPYTAGHQSRVANLARAIATEMGLCHDKIEGIHMAGNIHDIGKLSIPVEILSKPTKLTNLEFSMIKEHPQSGYEMLKHVESPWPLAQIVQQHHERINGSGYPRNLKGNEILLEARILAVADVVEAMASHRPYRAAIGIEQALEEIEKNKGIIYDVVVVDACLKLFREKGYHFKQI